MSTELTNKAGETLRKGRLPAPIKTACALIVEQGLTIAEAAQRVGYKRESLAKALIKPHVRAFREGLKRAWLESQTERAWVTVANLADTAVSEDVRLKACRTILEAAGELGPKDAGPTQPSVLIQIMRQYPDRVDGAGETRAGIIEVLHTGTVDTRADGQRYDS